MKINPFHHEPSRNPPATRYGGIIARLALSLLAACVTAAPLPAQTPPQTLTLTDHTVSLEVIGDGVNKFGTDPVSQAFNENTAVGAVSGLADLSGTRAGAVLKARADYAGPGDSNDNGYQISRPNFYVQFRNDSASPITLSAGAIRADISVAFSHSLGSDPLAGWSNSFVANLSDRMGGNAATVSYRAVGRADKDPSEFVVTPDATMGCSTIVRRADISGLDVSLLFHGVTIAPNDTFDFGLFLDAQASVGLSSGGMTTAGFSASIDAGHSAYLRMQLPPGVTVSSPVALPWAATPTPGIVDATFNPGTGAELPRVSALAVQPDGKILLGGQFESYNGVGRPGLVRLNSNGSIDTGFTPAMLGGVLALALQGDGKILVGDPLGLARLNANGSLDTSFDSGNGPNGGIESIAVQSDGKIIFGGIFDSYDSNVSNFLARANADGSGDTSFHPGNNLSDIVSAVAVLPNGKILIGGGFRSYGAVARPGLARLNADSSLDTSFAPVIAAGGNSPAVSSLVVQPDGKIVIAGSFATVNGVPCGNVARLNANGSLDATFDPGDGQTGSGVSSAVFAVAVQSDRKVVIVGGFGFIRGVARNHIARLNADGSLDTTFDPGTGANNQVSEVALQADGKVVVGGEFTTVDGSPRSGIARLLNDAPVVTSAATAVAQVGVPFSYQITATRNPTAFGVVGLPAGLSVNAAGLISGTPTAAGTRTLTLRATNASGTGIKTLTLTIKPPKPVITSAATANATVGTPFSYQIMATNNPTNYAVGGQQPGLHLDAATGVISGTPTGPAGTFSLTLRAANSGGIGTKTLDLTIAPAAPVITSAGTATAKIGTAFSYQIVARNNPASYSVLGLRPGLSVDRTTGLISGTPTGPAGTFSLKLRATNSAGMGQKVLNLTITN